MRTFALLAASTLVPAIVLAAPASPAGTAPGDLDVKLGYDHTVGKYGQQRDTRLSTSSATVSYATDDWDFDVLVPYLEEKGPGRVIFLPGRHPIVVVGPGRQASGIGDVTAGVTRYVFDQKDRGVDLDLDAIVKFGTASASKALGTGKNDLSLQAAIGRSLGPVDTTLTAGYTFVGKAAGLDLRNSAYGSLDANYHVARAVSVGATYDLGQTVARGTRGSRDLTAYVDVKPSKRVTIELYYLHGYTTQSPDKGGGITVQCAL